jgi:hypothetical protein
VCPAGFGPGDFQFASASFGRSGALVSLGSCSVLSDSLLRCAGLSGVGVDHGFEVTVAGQPSGLTGPLVSFAPPSISAVSPDRFPTDGGTNITVTGDDFGPPASRSVWQTLNATAFVRLGPWQYGCSVVNTTVMVCVTTAGAGALWAPQPGVGGQNGSSSSVSMGYEPPLVLSVPPLLGGTRGGTNVTVTGRCVRRAARHCLQTPCTHPCARSGTSGCSTRM